MIYSHVNHSDVDEEFKVGCICAEKMTNDYVTPKRLEKNYAKELKEE